MQFKTVIPGRVSGEVKFHKTLRAAQAAFRPSYLAFTPKEIPRHLAGSYPSVEEHPFGQIYELVNGQWTLLYDVKEDTSLPYRMRIVKVRYHEPSEIWSRDSRPWVNHNYVY